MPTRTRDITSVLRAPIHDFIPLCPHADPPDLTLSLPNFLSRSSWTNTTHSGWIPYLRAVAATLLPLTFMRSRGLSRTSRCPHSVVPTATDPLHSRSVLQCKPNRVAVYVITSIPTLCRVFPMPWFPSPTTSLTPRKPPAHTPAVTAPRIETGSGYSNPVTSSHTETTVALIRGNHSRPSMAPFRPHCSPHWGCVLAQVSLTGTQPTNARVSESRDRSRE